MTEPREIIARALCESSGKNPDQVVIGMALWETYSRIADAILATLAAAGYKMLPREPTEAMLKAAMAETATDLAAEYRAMWDASQ